jgi:hypothetical protein
MEGQKVERNKTVKCLHILIACMGVFLDDGLKWKEQVESVRRHAVFCWIGQVEEVEGRVHTKRKIYNAYCHTWIIVL